MEERRSARAILIDDLGRLILIKRSKPGQEPYWTTPGGGVEETDTSIEFALHRELMEELGATARNATQVLTLSSPSGDGLSTQHFFVARLVSIDSAARSGPEFEDASRGGYDLDPIDLNDDSLEAVDLKPTEIKEFVLANREALLLQAGVASPSVEPPRSL